MSKTPHPSSATVYAPFIKRNKYFHGKSLSARDFADEQDYHREKRRLYNRCVHGWGIVCGLDITVKDDQVVVSPGLAIDACGREIVVARAVALPVPQPKRAWFVVVQYAERETDPVSALSGGAGTQNSRIEEGVEISLSVGMPRADREPDAGTEPHPVCIGKVVWRNDSWRVARVPALRCRRR